MRLWKKIIIGLLLLPLGYTGGDVLVFKNGSRMEVKDLKIGTGSVTYTINAMTATVPLRYIDLELTQLANEELRAIQEAERKAAEEKKRQAEAAALIPRPDSVPLGDLAGRSLSDKEVQEVLQKWMKRHEGKTKLVSRTTGAAPPPDWAGSFQIPFRSEGGVMMVSAQVNSQAAASFVFDTGASITAISTELAYRANVKVDRSQSHTVHTANGPTRCYIGVMESLLVGDLEVRSLPVVVVENCRENLLGQNLIANFTVMVDNRRQVIELKPNS
jgi:clan AA aspartic protease (TIGR02281 family)